MVDVGEYTDCESLEIGDGAQEVRLVYFPEGLVEVFAQTVLDHFVLVLGGEVI